MSPAAAASIAPAPDDVKADESAYACARGENLDVDRVSDSHDDGPGTLTKSEATDTDERKMMISCSSDLKDHNNMTLSNYCCSDGQPDLCELESSSTAAEDDDHDGEDDDDLSVSREEVPKHDENKQHAKHEHEIVESGDSVEALCTTTSVTSTHTDSNDDGDECEDTDEKGYADNATADAVDESVGESNSIKDGDDDDEAVSELNAKPPGVIHLPSTSSTDEDTDNVDVGNGSDNEERDTSKCQRKKPTRLADPSSGTLKKTLVDSDRMRTIQHDENDDSRSCGGDSSAWMHLRSSSLLEDGDINILPVPVPPRGGVAHAGTDIGANGHTSSGVANTAEVSDAPPVHAVAAPSTTAEGQESANIITADVVYPVPVPTAPPPTPSAAQDVPLPPAVAATAAARASARGSSSSTSASGGGEAAFPDLLQQEDKQDQFSPNRPDSGADWLRDDVAIAQELDDANRRQQQSDSSPGASALRKSIATLRKSAERGSIAKARKAAASSITSVDIAMGKLLRDGKTVARKGNSSATTQPLSSLAIETEAGPLLPRTLLPSSIRHSDQTQQWVASIHTDQKSLDLRRNTLAERGVVTMSFESENEARAAVDAFTPPRNLPFKDSPVCFICMAGFKVWKRAGHCRNCGVCICSKCSTTWPSEGLPSTYNIKRESMVRVCNTCGWLSTSFRTALLTGEQDKAVAIYSTGNVNLRCPFVNCKGETLYPIHCAAMGGSTAMLKWLVDECYCPITSSANDGKRRSGAMNTLLPLLTSRGRSILDIAVSKQNVDMLRYVVVQKDISVLGVKDMKAALLSLDAVLRRLLDESSGANDVLDCTPLDRRQSRESSAAASDREDTSLPLEQEDTAEIGAMAHLSHYEEMSRAKSC
mmetsp:Transcript_25751/g.56437  ORF Transcript_25751/g.56437 Transcript_25751/m.56437 type:complete len:878 (-) Transcript_25751:2462-5095(-)